MCPFYLVMHPLNLHHDGRSFKIERAVGGLIPSPQGVSSIDKTSSGEERVSSLMHVTAVLTAG
jgi:hypothetical protein